jgi:hypothetical protein
VTVIPDEEWFACLPGCEAMVPCGRGTHAVRWEAGSLLLPEHPDAEAELVLAALGGEKARCVEVAQAWARHTDDLSVLAIGPRGPGDDIVVGWDDVAAVQQGAGGGFAFTGSPAGRQAVLRPAAGLHPSVPAGVQRRRVRAQEELELVRRRRTDMLSLLALGYGFQVRLAGHVAAAYSEGGHAEGAHAEGAHATAGAGAGSGEAAPGRARPALMAAMAGRLGPVAEQWLGIDPDQVVVSLHAGPGWGSVELTGRGERRRLQVALPILWLARVWAAGLALVDRHLVVAVERAGWPDARVLGLRAPGAEPEPLEVHDGGDGTGHAPHWEV